MDRRSSKEAEISIQLQTPDTGIPSRTLFEPQSSIERIYSSNANSYRDQAPEKKLTLFALRLAVLEKTATRLGTLGFIWATVVLLGGFAVTLEKTDFWVITIILLIEGTRIFSRSHELEWQHQATWLITDAGINSFRALISSSSQMIDNLKAIFRPIFAIGKGSQTSREIAETCGTSNPATPTRWPTSDVPLLPYAQSVLLTRHVSKLLYWLQILSASACVALSLMKLIKQDYGDVEKGDIDKRNRRSSLNIFYSLALAEALLFLMEKAYLEWKVRVCKVLDMVNNECKFGDSGMISTRRFFYDAYSKCVNGSIFDGLKMDMAIFGMDLLGSSFRDERLIGAKILHQFSFNLRYKHDTLQKIGVNFPVIEKLVEMLNWTDPQEEETRKCAAAILSKLVGKRQNSLRVAGIPGAMESISSLLQTSRSSGGAADEISERQVVSDHPSYEFNHLGLLILKKLARNHDICGKIGSTRGLLPKIIDFTHAEERLLKDERAATSQIVTVKRSLQVVKRLASTTGATGKQLRREISEIIFTISNIRDILRHGEQQPILQQLGIEILTSLALEEDATERIGGTGGVLKGLFNIFFNQDLPKIVRIAAGEALAMLALESINNCHRMLKLEVLERLVRALEDSLLQVNAARILINLCTYSGAESYKQLKEVTIAAPTVLQAIMSRENKLQEATIAAPTVLQAIMSRENKLQEVMVGLGAHIFKFMNDQESSQMFARARITQAELAHALVLILKKYQQPHIKIPRIRRFAIELAIWMMRDKASNVRIFNDLGMEKELEGVLETTAELESFNTFSGTVGMSRHSTTIHSLVETALSLLLEGSK